MSVAAGFPRLSNRPIVIDGSQTQNIAAVLEFRCLFTQDLRRKQKRWQDGRLKFHTFNNRVMVYDERSNFVGDAHWRESHDLDDGEEFELERGGYMVQVSECIGKDHQDLSELIDRRVKEKEQRHVARKAAISPLSTRTQMFSSVASASMAMPQAKPKALKELLGTPTGHYGKAAVITLSPFEQRTRLEQRNLSEGGAERPAKRRKADISPPSKHGYAQNLTGATLTLTAKPFKATPSLSTSLRNRANQSDRDITTIDLTKSDQESTITGKTIVAGRSDSATSINGSARDSSAGVDSIRQKVVCSPRRDPNATASLTSRRDQPQNCDGASVYLEKSSEGRPSSKPNNVRIDESSRSTGSDNDDFIDIDHPNHRTQSQRSEPEEDGTSRRSEQGTVATATVKRRGGPRPIQRDSIRRIRGEEGGPTMGSRECDDSQLVAKSNAVTVTVQPGERRQPPRRQLMCMENKLPRSRGRVFADKAELEKHGMTKAPVAAAKDYVSLRKGQHIDMNKTRNRNTGKISSRNLHDEIEERVPLTEWHYSDGSVNDVFSDSQPKLEKTRRGLATEQPCAAPNGMEGQPWGVALTKTPKPSDSSVQRGAPRCVTLSRIRSVPVSVSVSVSASASVSAENVFDGGDHGRVVQHALSRSPNSVSSQPPRPQAVIAALESMASAPDSAAMSQRSQSPHTRRRDQPYSNDRGLAVFPVSETDCQNSSCKTITENSSEETTEAELETEVAADISEEAIRLLDFSVIEQQEKGTETEADDNLLPTSLRGTNNAAATTAEGEEDTRPEFFNVAPKQPVTSLLHLNKGANPHNAAVSSRTPYVAKLMTNPATRGRKAAQRSDAAGRFIPKDSVPQEPPPPPLLLLRRSTLIAPPQINHPPCRTSSIQQVVKLPTPTTQQAAEGGGRKGGGGGVGEVGGREGGVRRRGGGPPDDEEEATEVTAAEADAKVSRHFPHTLGAWTKETLDLFDWRPPVLDYTGKTGRLAVS